MGILLILSTWSPVHEVLSLSSYRVPSCTNIGLCLLAVSVCLSHYFWQAAKIADDEVIFVFPGLKKNPKPHLCLGVELHTRCLFLPRGFATKWPCLGPLPCQGTGHPHPAAAFPALWQGLSPCSILVLSCSPLGQLLRLPVSLETRLRVGKLQGAGCPQPRGSPCSPEPLFPLSLLLSAPV